MSVVQNKNPADQTELPRLLKSLQGYLGQEIENMTTLLPEHYTNEAMYNLEIEEIWKKNWICVGHTHQFKNAGDYVGFELIDEPIVLVKGEDEVIRAMSAVCRHRFMPIVSHGERGNISQLQCIYHRWTYGLNGKLNNATFMESNNCFENEKDDIKLPEFRLEIWNNFIFINLDDDAEPLAPKLVELDPFFKPQVETTKEHWHATELYDKIWDANWKTSNENSLESYHHMGVHTGSLELFAPTRNLEDPMIAKEAWSRWVVPYDMDREAGKSMIEASGWKKGDFGQDEPQLEIIMIPPTNAITISPGGVGWFTMWPTGPEETRVFCASIGDIDEDRAEHFRQLAGEEFNENYIERVMDEDGLAMPGIRRALRSGNLQPGKLSWTEEPILRWYQWIARQLADADTGAVNKKPARKTTRKPAAKKTAKAKA